MTKIAKTLGADASPEAVSKMTREIEAQQKRVAATRTTITETFQRVMANEMMVKADFEVTVPSDSAPVPK